MTFRPSSGPWGYAHDAIEHIEEHNCRHGCRHGAEPGSTEWSEVGPGGSCGVLCEVFTEETVDALTFDGTTVTCTAYRKRTTPAPVPVTEDQLTIGEQ